MRSLREENEAVFSNLNGFFSQSIHENERRRDHPAGSLRRSRYGKSLLYVLL